MDLKWYKNKFYILAILTLLFIVGIAIVATVNLPATIVIQGIKPEFSFTVQVILQSIFNPFWIIFNYFIGEARKLEDGYHRDILKYLQGIVVQAIDNNQKRILTSTLSAVLVQSDDIVKKIHKSLDSGVSVSATPGDPTI